MLNVNFLDFHPGLTMADFLTPAEGSLPLELSRKGRTFSSAFIIQNCIIEFRLHAEIVPSMDGLLVVTTDNGRFETDFEKDRLPDRAFLASFRDAPGIGMMIIPITRFTSEELEAYVFPRLIKLAQEGFHGDIDTHVDTLGNVLDLVHVVIVSNTMPDDVTYEFYGAANLLSRADDRHYAQKSMSL